MHSFTRPKDTVGAPNMKGVKYRMSRLNFRGGLLSIGWDLLISACTKFEVSIGLASPIMNIGKTMQNMQNRVV